MKTKSYKLPSRSELAALVRDVRSQISPEYRVSDDADDNTPGICLTVGANLKGEWSYQTGDNSFTGGAYHFPHWAVVSVYKDSHSYNLADEIREELAEALHNEAEGIEYDAKQTEERLLKGAGLHPSQTGFKGHYLSISDLIDS